jgi:hypothetical protein
MKTPEDKVKQEIFIEYIRAKLPEAWDFAEKASKLLLEEENQHEK